MKSTGEVMGIDSCFPLAYWKSQIAAGQRLPFRPGVPERARFRQALDGPDRKIPR
jgi:hypothetical protein